MKKIAILGGGIAGTSLGHILNKKHQITIFEGDEHAGGLARSHFYEDFYYDIGPHIIFSKNIKVLEFMKNMDKDLIVHQRSNQIWYKNQLIKYPFENNLYKLTIREKNDCLYTFLNNPYKNIKPNEAIFGSLIPNLYTPPGVLASKN